MPRRPEIADGGLAPLRRHLGEEIHLLDELEAFLRTVDHAGARDIIRGVVILTGIAQGVPIAHHDRGEARIVEFELGPPERAIVKIG